MAEFGNISFYQKTLQRALLFTNTQDIFIITNADYKFHALNQAKQM
jgi:mannose-1-phosphate guanylyltransferase